MRKLHLLLLFLITMCSPVAGQQAWFVDGYHGGIYGHFPIETHTDFMVESMEKYPDWKICIEIEPETWDSVKMRTPRAYDDFKKITSDSRMEFTNPTYAQPYCYNISAESIIRQFDYGMRLTNAHFPDVQFSTYSCEEPCFTSCMPHILNSFGFKYAVLKSPDTMFGGYASPYDGELVNWIGSDGTSILTVPRYACEEAQPGSTWQTRAWNNQSEYLEACREYGIEHPVGMCFQDAGWEKGPWIGYGDKVRNNSIYVTWREYFEHISSGETYCDYRMGQEDLHVSLMWGSQVLQRIARRVRNAENTLSMTEKLGAMAAICDGYPYRQSQLDEAWRTLMLAQHHDAWIVPYNTKLSGGRRSWAESVDIWCDSSQETCNTVMAGAMASFDTGKNSGASVCVFNTLGVNRKEPVAVTLPDEYKGREVVLMDISDREIEAYSVDNGSQAQIEFEADVPPFGYATYRLEMKENNRSRTVGKSAEQPETGELVVENDMYRIVFDPSKGGTMKSLISKKDDSRDFAPGIDSSYYLGEIRGFFYEQERFHSSADNQATVTLVSDNALRKTVLIEGHIDSHPFKETITLTEGQERLDFELVIDWQGNPGIGEYRQSSKTWRTDNNRGFYNDRYKLSVLFPTSLSSPELWKNAPFDVCKSRLESTEYSDWDKIEHNVILNWVDIAEQNGSGLALLSDHTTSYCYGSDFPLGLTLQYSGGGLFGRDYPITEATRVNFALIPHSGKWEQAGVDRQSESWNEPLIGYFSRSVEPENLSLIDIEGTGYTISAASITDDGILVRLFNTTGDDNSPQKIKLGFNVSFIREVDLRGDTVAPVCTTKHKGKYAIETNIPKFGFKTFIIN